MQNRFGNIIRGLFPAGETVLLAVSGGIDSMCMAELCLGSGTPFAVASCNFHLRGEESDGDIGMVEAWCKDHGIEFFRSDFDTKAYASENGVSIEMAARELRYRWFEKLCRENGFAAVAVAHNANDNAETLLLNMLRGSGIKGMTGMKPVTMVPVPGSSVTLVRPLLSFSRAEIEDYVSAHGVPFREDSTNAQTEYQRNKLRHQVFPVLETLNPSFLETLGRDMSNLAQVAAVADEWYSEARKMVVAFESPDELRISQEKLMASSQRDYLLWRIAEPYGFNSSDVASMADILSSETVSGKTLIAGEWRMVTSSSEIIICRKSAVGMVKKSGAARCVALKGGVPFSVSAVNESEECVVVEGPGVYEIGGIRFSVEVAERTAGLQLRQPGGVTIADAKTMALPFLVRKWRAGDWMVPMGLHGRKKLSDMFVDLKMSLVDKESALVAVVPGMNPHGEGPVRVASLLGRRIDEGVMVTENTSGIVIVRILS